MGQWIWSNSASTFNASGIGQRLKNIKRSLKNPRGILAEMGEIALEITRDTMEQERDPVTGRKWRKLKPATIRAKGYNRILWKTGALQRSFRRRAAGNVWRLSRKSLTIGTSLPQGIHDKGVPRRNVPARRFMGYSKGRQALIMKPIRNMLRRGGRRG